MKILHHLTNQFLWQIKLADALGSGNGNTLAWFITLVGRLERICFSDSGIGPTMQYHSAPTIEMVIMSENSTNAHIKLSHGYHTEGHRTYPMEKFKLYLGSN